MDGLSAACVFAVTLGGIALYRTYLLECRVENVRMTLTERIAQAQAEESRMEERVGAALTLDEGKIAEDEAKIATLQKAIDDMKAQGFDPDAVAAAEAALEGLTARLAGFHAAPVVATDTPPAVPPAG